MPIPANGNVLTPPGFQIQSCEGLVQLTWQYTPLATTFYINRSSDGVSFTNIGETSQLYYNDSSGTVGTIYYYQVQAATSAASSLPTLSLQGLSLEPGQTTLGNLRQLCQWRCNFENKPFITNQEWGVYITNSYKELYDIILSKYGCDYYVQFPFSYTTSGTIDPQWGCQVFPLPDDFYKGLRCEVALNPSDPNSWVTLREFQAIQANLWNYPNVYTFYGITNLRYRFWGPNLQIVPISQAGQTIRIWYAPRPNQLINDTDTIDGVSGWEEYIVADCCIKALTKEESDPSIFVGQKAALLKRIEEIAENRNIGEPETVSDSKMRNFAWTDDGTSGGGNGWY